MPSPTSHTQNHKGQCFPGAKFSRFFLKDPRKGTAGWQSWSIWTGENLYCVYGHNGVHSEHWEGSFLESGYSHAEEAICMTPIWSQMSRLSFPSYYISISTQMFLLELLAPSSHHVPNRWEVSSAFQKVMLSPSQKESLTCLSWCPQKWVLLHFDRHCRVTEFPWANNQGKNPPFCRH